jgi:hypothetical protein
MALTAETIELINRRAERIGEERAKKIAREKLAVSKHEVRKTNIRQEVADLNQQLAQDTQLKQNLFEVLRAKDGYQTYHEVDRIGSCIGLPIAQTSGQIALMTEEGIRVLESHSRARYGRSTGHHSIECFTPLQLDEANVDGLFPKPKFKVGQIADNIADIVLQSPNKK